MNPQKEFEVFLALQMKGIPLKLSRGKEPKREMSLEEMERVALTVRETFWVRLLKDDE